MTSSSPSSPASQNLPPTSPDESSKTPSPARSLAERVLVAALILGVDAYRATLSPLFRGSCRFDPSCSAYAREALLKHGTRGVWLASRRLLRCRPFGGFGFDPVP